MKAKNKSFQEMSSIDRRRMYRRRKRVHAFQRKMTILFITIMILVCSVISLNVFNAKAKSAQSDKTLYKYYKNVEIQPEDTLWDLAKENYCAEKQSFEEYIQEVKNINHLENDAIIAGNYIVLPYYSEIFVYN